MRLLQKDPVAIAILSNPRVPNPPPPPQPNNIQRVLNPPPPPQLKDISRVDVPRLSEPQYEFEWIIKTSLSQLGDEGIHPCNEHVAEECLFDHPAILHESIVARQSMRNNVEYIYTAKLLSSPSWKTQNVICEAHIHSMLRHRFRPGTTMTPDAQQFLSEAIQSHLHTVLESAIQVCRKRLAKNITSEDIQYVITRMKHRMIVCPWRLVR